VPSQEVGPLTRDLLRWIAGRRPSYAEVREVWPSTCPRLAIWEDALAAGLVRVVRDGSGSVVRVTPGGEALLAADAVGPIERPAR
jgi:hypothetical protein